MTHSIHFSVVTVTLNPAIDKTLFVSGFRAGQVNRATGTCSSAGGKGLNVSSFLADYGVSTLATGFLGDENDRIFAEHMLSKSIGDRFVRIPGKTRTGIKIVDELTRETTDINAAGIPPRQVQVAQLLRIIDELVQKDRWFVLSGSLPPGMSSDFYSALVLRIRQGGGRVALDTSAEALSIGVKAGPDIVKPNIDELRGLVGADICSVEEVLNAACRLGSHGIHTVAVSMGRAGAVFVEGEEAVLARPPEIDVKSTVAAGDAMVAGLLAGQHQYPSLEDRARLATAFSLCALSRVESGLDKGAVDKFESTVAVERLLPR